MQSLPHGWSQCLTGSREAGTVSLSITQLWLPVITNLVLLLLLISGVFLVYPAETSGSSEWKPWCRVKFQIFSYETGAWWDRLTISDIRVELLARLVSALHPAQGGWVCLEHRFFSPQENLQKIGPTAGKWQSWRKSWNMLGISALRQMSDAATTVAARNIP